MGDVIAFNEAVLDQTETYASNDPPLDPAALAAEPQQRRRKRSCGCKRGKGGVVLAVGSAFLVGFGLALVAAK